VGVEVLVADLATADYQSLLVSPELYFQTLEAVGRPGVQSGPCVQAGRQFEYVYDNFAKNVDTARPVAELALAQAWPVKDYVFVSSGRDETFST
jgi:hypothetical protein